MSIYDQPTPEQSQSVKNQVIRIERSIARLPDRLVRSWEEIFDSVWVERDGVTVAEKIAEIGTDAEEMLTDSAAFATFMIATLTGKRDDLVTRIQAKIATQPSYTQNPDGSITLD